MPYYYRPPGVYPEKVVNPSMLSQFKSIRTPVVIGPGKSTITATERILRTANVCDLLSEDVIAVTRIGDYVDQFKYTEGTDFSVHPVEEGYSDSRICWDLGGDEPDVTEYYFVTYTYAAPSSQYQFHIYTDLNEVYSIHGQPNTTNLVSLGAGLVLKNGAPQVGVLQLDLSDAVDPDNPSDSELYAAYIATIPILETLDTTECRYIVPMTTMGGYPGTVDYDAALFDMWEQFYQHVKDMSLTSQRRWRMLIRGLGTEAPIDTTTSTLVKGNAEAIADYFGSRASYDDDNAARRTIIVFPGEIYIVTQDATVGSATYGQWVQTLYDGSALAAAAAGRICSFDNAAETITWKDVAGWTTERIMSKADMDHMAEYGVCIYAFRGNFLHCRHALTTDRTDATTQEISVVEIEDFIKINAIQMLEQRYIGTLIVEGVTDSIRATWTATLEQMINFQTIAEYDLGSMSVTQDQNDPRIITIFCRIKPAYPLNWIDVKFQFYAGSRS